MLLLTNNNYKIATTNSKPCHSALFARQKRLDLCAWLFITINTTTTTHAYPNWFFKADWLSMAHLFLSVFSSHVRIPCDAQSCLPCAWCEAVRIPLISLSLSLSFTEKWHPCQAPALVPMPSATDVLLVTWRGLWGPSFGSYHLVRAVMGTGRLSFTVKKLRVKKKRD